MSASSANMAAAVGANLPFLFSPAAPPAAHHRLRLTPPSASIHFPAKRAKRKNHLRPKILKTLTKPLTAAPLPQIAPAETTAPNPIPLSPEKNESFSGTPTDEIEIPSEILPADETDKVSEYQVTETRSRAGVFSKVSEYQATETRSRAGVFSKVSVNTVLKFCVYLLGALVVQTIFTYLFMESANSSKKERRLVDLNGEGSALVNGSSVAYSEGTEMEEKINEIRAMAREARRREKFEREDDDEENDIEREIGARLAKLEKRLSSKREKLPGSLMNYLGLFGSENEEEDDDDNEEEEELNNKKLELEEDRKNLIFRKKHRFRSPSMESRTKPKGFSGLGEPSSNNSNGAGPNGLADNGREGMNLKQEKLNVQNESASVTESSRSKNLETKLNQKTPKKPNGFGGKKPEAKIVQKQSVAKPNLWWLNLPYVLAILIRRGPEHESAGLYVLRTLDGANGLGESAYTVAFEDRGDANNFCYLLESFFEDLGDFRADIVPLSTKEIQEELKSGTKNIIVVKKGQLKLYAGQPFAEVEIALRCLME